ncbi:MAG: M48 family metallopeptidase [Frankiales bacterium]|nr:M48 family metallopeptidase [Frankiales bacterium]
MALGVALAVLVPWTTLPDAPATADFTAAQIAREVAFHDEVRPAAYASLGLGLLLLGVLGLTSWGARLVGRLAGRWWLQVVLGTLVVTGLGRLVVLPLSVRNEGVLRDYGLSSQTWAGWSVDLLKGIGVDSAITAVALLAVVGLARVARRTWWAWAAAATAGLVVAGSFAYPLLVEPVFNNFTSLQQGQLRADLLALAKRDGVPVQDVLVADASRRTTALNAYVSGFGGSRRIVVYDTLLKQAPAAEVELVVAHELGHAKAQDVRNGTLLGALGAATAVCVLALLLSWAPLLRRSGASGVGDGRVVPLLLLLVAVGTQLTGPAANLVSRQVEARADTHALDLTGDPATFIAVQRRLALANLSDLHPNPVAYALYATHPSTTQRIALARERQR